MNEVLHTWDDSAARVKTNVIGIRLRDDVGTEYDVKGLRHNVQILFERDDEEKATLDLLSSNTNHYTNVTANTTVYNISCAYPTDTLMLMMKSPDALSIIQLFVKYDEYVNETFYDFMEEIHWQNDTHQIKHFLDCPPNSYATVLVVGMNYFY